jgi:glucokinase
MLYDPYYYSLMHYLLGVDLGGTKTSVVLGTGGMSIVARRGFATAEAGGPMAVLDRIASCAESILLEAGCPKESVSACGISAGGPLDPTRGIIFSPPNLPGWDEFPVTALLRERIGVPCRLENDANACALAEWKLGAGKGTSTMVFLTFGTGMGAGIIVDGRLHRGADCLAGEIGHIRLSRDGPEAYGKRGSFEAFCSGAGIAKMAGEAALRKLDRGEEVGFCPGPGAVAGITTREVALSAARGDKLAISILARSGRRLGYGLAALIDLLNPDAIVIGSVFARCRDFLWPAARRVIAREALPAAAKRCRIEPAALGEELGDYAAMIIADGG